MNLFIRKNTSEKRSCKSRQAFTLIEMLIYVAIISLFLVAAIRVTWDVVYTRERAVYQQVVQQELRLINTQVEKVIAQAEEVISLNPDRLELLTQTGNMTVELIDGVISLNEGGQAYALSSNEVEVVDITFEQSSNDNTSNVTFNLSIRPNVVASSKFSSISDSSSSTIELKSAFSQARRLLISLDNVALSANRRDIEGLQVSNTADSTVIIDKLLLDWTGTDPGINFTAVQLDGGAEEWTGQAVSGEEIDIGNFELGAQVSAVPLNYLAFDSAIDGATVGVQFILLDGSKREVSLEFAQAVAPNPSPTPTAEPTPTPGGPTPTPVIINSCNDYCLSQGFGSGVCLQNAKKCDQAGGTYSSAGSAYCTGGANADSCCCQ